MYKYIFGGGEVRREGLYRKAYLCFTYLTQAETIVEIQGYAGRMDLWRPMFERATTFEYHSESLVVRRAS